MVNEIPNSITYDFRWSSKASENMLLDELDHKSWIIWRKSDTFTPFTHIVNNNKDILVSIGWQEGNHEVNTPYIKISTLRTLLSCISWLLNIIPNLWHLSLTFTNKNNHQIKRARSNQIVLPYALRTFPHNVLHID